MLGKAVLEVICHTVVLQQGFASQTYQQRVAQGRGIIDLSHPGFKRLSSGGQDLVGFLASPAAVLGRGFYQPSLFQAAKLAIDLLMRGRPEKSDRAIETPRQFQARAWIFQQCIEQSMGKRHRVRVPMLSCLCSISHHPLLIATNCNWLQKILIESIVQRVAKWRRCFAQPILRSDSH